MKVSPSVGTPPSYAYSPFSATNSWQDVADLAETLGIPLDPFQKQILECGLGERPDGKWSARLIGCSVARQNGKSQVIVARALAGVLLFGEKTIIISAHQTDTAREVFQRLVDVIEDNPDLGKRVQQVNSAIGRESIRFKNKAVIRIKARNNATARGYSCDLLLLDEAQILSASAWAGIMPTMSARPNPQSWLFGTPPTPADDSEVFYKTRQTGLKGKAGSTAWIEWAADPDSDFDSEATWAKANPAYGFRISKEAVEAERASMSDAEFARERLGIWDETTSPRVIPAETWNRLADVNSIAVGALVLAVDVSPDRSIASVAVAGQREDKLWHVELADQRAGVSWLVPWLVERVKLNPIRAVVIDRRSEAASLVPDLRRQRVKVTEIDTATVVAACGRFYDSVVDGSLKHIGQPQLDAALNVARKRPLSGGWAWNRATATSDITAIVATTNALWGTQNLEAVKRPTDQKRKVIVYG